MVDFICKNTIFAKIYKLLENEKITSIRIIFDDNS